MPYPTISPGNDPTLATKECKDPSGFADAGFDARQKAKACECIQLMMREWIDRSGMPQTIFARLPENVSLYTTGTPVRGDIMSSDTEHNIASDLDIPLRIRPHSDVSLMLGMDTEFLRDTRLQINTKVRVLLHMANLVSSQFSNPMNYTRDAAWHFGIADNLNPPPAGDSFYLQVENATTGLSAPDEGAVMPPPSATSAMDSALKGALRGVPVGALWKLYGECIALAERSGYCLNNAEVDEMVRTHLPEHAERILAHPAFRELKEGRHAIAYTMHNKERAYVEGFEIKKKGPLYSETDRMGAAWMPTLYDVQGKAMRWTLDLLSKSGNVLHSKDMPFVATRSLYAADLKDIDNATIKAAPKVHMAGQQYRIKGNGMEFLFDRAIKFIKSKRK